MIESVAAGYFVDAEAEAGNGESISKNVFIVDRRKVFLSLYDVEIPIGEPRKAREMGCDEREWRRHVDESRVRRFRVRLPLLAVDAVRLVEEAASADGAVHGQQVLAECPRQLSAFRRIRAAEQLVDQHQTALRDVLENVLQPPRLEEKRDYSVCH